MRIMMEISADGSSRILKVIDIAGKYRPVSRVTSDRVLEVTDGTQTKAVIPLANTPFQIRAAFDPKDPARGHKISESAKAIVAVDVPDTTISKAAGDNLGIKILKINPGPQPKTIDSRTLQELKDAGRISTEYDLPSERLKPELRRAAKPEQPK